MPPPPPPPPLISEPQAAEEQECSEELLAEESVIENPHRAKPPARASWLGKISARSPWRMVGCLVVLVVVAGYLGISKRDIPDFSDATAGFEPRGTVMKGEMMALRWLHRAADWGMLSTLKGMHGLVAEMSGGAALLQVTAIVGDPRVRSLSALDWEKQWRVATRWSPDYASSMEGVLAEAEEEPLKHSYEEHGVPSRPLEAVWEHVERDGDEMERRLMRNRRGSPTTLQLDSAGNVETYQSSGPPHSKASQTGVWSSLVQAAETTTSKHKAAPGSGHHNVASPSVPDSANETVVAAQTTSAFQATLVQCGGMPAKFGGQVLALNAAEPLLFVYKPATTSLLSQASLLQMCKDERQLRTAGSRAIGPYCVRADVDAEESIPRQATGEKAVSPKLGKCCTSRSLHETALALDGASPGNCEAITEGMAQKLRNIILKCAPFVRDGQMDDKCRPEVRLEVCPEVPAECIRRDMVIYDTIFSQIDSKYPDQASPLGGPVMARVMIPHVPEDWMRNPDTMIEEMLIFWTDTVEPLLGSGPYARLDNAELAQKFNLFNESLLTDAMFAGGAIVAVFVLLWIHNGSVFISAVGFLIIFSALIIAFFVFHILLWMPLFPFLNLVVVFVIVGIGADDIFVYIDTWKQSFTQLPITTPLPKRITWTIDRAMSAMFVTTFTTAAAFFVNCISPITSIRCFGLYAGLVVTLNFMILVCVLPSAVVIAEFGTLKNTPAIPCPLCAIPVGGGPRRVEVLLKNALQPVIARMKWGFIVVLLVLGFGGLKLGLTMDKPSSSEFQVFAKNHPFERYALEQKSLFQLEQTGGGSRQYFPVQAVFGVVPQDTGSAWNNTDRGKLEFQPVFNAATMASQKFFLRLVDELRDQPFIKNPSKLALTPNSGGVATARNIPSNGTMATSVLALTSIHGVAGLPEKQLSVVERFERWLSLPCKDVHMCKKEQADGVLCNSYFECCQGRVKLPAPELDFKRCAARFAASDIASGFFFDMQGNMKAVVLEVESKTRYTKEFAPAEQWWSQVDAWRSTAMKAAPAELAGAYVVVDTGGDGQLEWYHLQQALDSGAREGIAISLVLALLVLLGATKNYILSCYAIVAIVCILGALLGTLVAMGWTFSLTVSLILCVAVGMCVDFVIHFSHAFKHAPGKDRADKAEHTLTEMGASVTLGAFTTVTAAAALLPCQSLFFQQFGAFLLLIMGFSWLYSMIFLQSTLTAMGPTGKAGDCTVL